MRVDRPALRQRGVCEASDTRVRHFGVLYMTIMHVVLACVALKRCAHGVHFRSTHCGRCESDFSFSERVTNATLSTLHECPNVLSPSHFVQGRAFAI